MKTLKAWEAVKALEEGKKIRNLSWKKNDYMYLKDGSLFGEDNYKISHDLYGFINHGEWQLYEEPKPQVWEWRTKRSEICKWTIYTILLTEEEANQTFEHHYKYEKLRGPFEG